jgi:hypothetical protein
LIRCTVATTAPYSASPSFPAAPNRATIFGRFDARYSNAASQTETMLPFGLAGSAISRSQVMKAVSSEAGSQVSPDWA